MDFLNQSVSDIYNNIKLWHILIIIAFAMIPIMISNIGRQKHINRMKENFKKDREKFERRNKFE